MKVNAAECLTCGERIESKHRHDYVACGCPRETFVAVDGGQDYERRAFGEKARWRDPTSGEVFSAEEIIRERTQQLEQRASEEQMFDEAKARVLNENREALKTLARAEALELLERYTRALADIAYGHINIRTAQDLALTALEGEKR